MGIVTDRPRRGFDLGDYVEVKDRIRMFYEAYPEGRLSTGEVRLTGEPDGKSRVWVQALAYRTPDDPHPSVGWSWMELPGTTPYTRGSELENTETSAWGRAIGALGIGIDKGIASAQEVRTKEREAESHDDGLIGTVEAGRAPVDTNLRDSAEGPAVGFKLVEGRKGLQVLALGPLAQVLAPLLPEIVGQRVKVWGRVVNVPWKKDGRDMPPYQRVMLERIEAPEWTLPAADIEAPTATLFSEEESAAIDEALAV